MRILDKIMILKNWLFLKKDFIFVGLSLLSFSIFFLLQVDSIRLGIAELIQKIYSNDPRGFYYWYSELTSNSFAFLFFGILFFAPFFFGKYKTHISSLLTKVSPFFKINEQRFKVILVILSAVFFRFMVSSFGHNFDFESYTIVGKIVSAGGNVYAQTTRYNYAPVYSLILGIFYSISSNFSDNIPVFRFLVVSLLSVFDIAIGLFLYKKYSFKLMVLFLLNPISIIITGYHNQFDNIAVYFALVGAFLMNQDDKFTKKDVMAISFLSLSLIVKHLLFILPIWILFRENLPNKKKVAYSFVPVLVFLLSFVPYLKQGWSGILHNVFLYSSMNNFPLLNKIFAGWFGLDIHKSFILFFLFFMFWLGWTLRKKSFEEMILYYFIGLVCFSSAVANQYLIIPIASLCILGKDFKYLYFFAVGLYLAFTGVGLHIGDLYLNNGFVDFFLVNGYFLATWILLAVLFVNVMVPSFKENNVEKIG